MTDIEKELITMMASELMDEINRAVVIDLLNMADPYRNLAKKEDFEFDEQDNNKWDLKN